MPREPAAAEDVVARLGTDEATGLTGEEAARLLKLYGPNLVADHPLAGGRLLATLKCILLLLGWDHSFTEYIKYEIGWESWEHLIFPWCREMLYAGMLQTTYELAVIVSLLAGSLCACFVAKVLANRAKAPLEAKAFVRRTKVLRDGIWKHEDAANLVPGDIIYLKCGDIVPANACVLNMAQIDTKTIRHERHVSYVMGSLIYYGWAVSCGEGTAVVTATGNCIPTSTLKLYPRRFSRPGQLRKGVMATGTFCFCLVLVGITSEVLVKLFFHQSIGTLHSGHFMPLIGLIPMSMPAVLYLALALGSRRLSKLGVASRGTFALEDLASMDAMLFNMTGTLTCNKPYFDKDKIEVLTDGIDKDHAVLLAARASKAHNELYKEPIDAAILGLMDDPEQVRVGINVIEHRSRMFVAMTLMYMTTYIDGNGSKCSVLKGDPALMLRDCSCSNEVKEHIRKRIDTLGLDGHQCIAVGRIVNSRLDIISLLPFIDDLRGDSAEAVVNLTDMSLSVIVLTESPMTITKHVCGRLGKLGLNVLHADSMREMVSSKNELFLNINGISDLFVEYNRYVISNLRTYFGRRSAMVGYEFSDADSIRESDIGIAVADATDSTKSESDIVLTEHALLCVSSAVQTSREICQIMKGCMVYAVSSTVHAFTVRLILLLWRLELPCFPMLVIAACNYCTSTAMLFERAKSSQSPDSLKAKKIIVTGAAFGSYVALSTVVFFIFTTRTDFISVATVIAVYGVANSPLPKGIGWGWAGFIWLYNFVLLLSLMLICYLCNLAKFNISGITCRRLFTSWTQWMEKCRRVLNRGQMWMVMLIFPAISGLILVWSICAYHAMKVQQQ
uniref:E1-E2 ATPase family protein n=1 Tax=Oryza sativa subsp. japonica TaxID=39947 RepID=Q2R444_ORYSJ|nr:E1-E2 ATPase family protein [Oryza sativa Japonica Group]